MVIVFVRKIENLSDAEKQNIISSLSSSALKRLESKRNKGLYNASLCALSLLSDVQRAALDYTDGGRPFFKNLNADISISHSRTYSAVAISEDKNESVGIDIEEAQSNKISIRFLTENEQISLENGTPYLKIWTKKEALFKYLKNDNLSLISLDSTAPELHGAKFITLPVGDNILTACTERGTIMKIIEK